MKLSQLKYFQTICKYNNITRASNELHVSQPCLSNAIRELEDELGVTLFYRLSKGLVLTEEGNMLLEHATDILNRVDQMIMDITSSQTDDHEVKLGIPPMIGTLVFPDILQNLRLEYPHTQLSIVERGSTANKSLVLDGELDAAIVSGDEPLPAAFGSIDICTLKIFFYTSIENPIAYMTQLDIEKLPHAPLVLLSEDSFITAFVKDRFKQYNMKPNILLHTNQLHTIQKLVDNNTASTFLFDGILTPNDNIISIPMEDKPETKIRLIWNKTRKQSMGTKNLIRLVQSRSTNQ